MKNSYEKFVNNFIISITTVLILLTMGLLVFVGCSKDSDSPKQKDLGSVQPTDSLKMDSVGLDLGYLPMGNGSTNPYMKGTFIDFWYKAEWGSAEWEEHMKEMQEVGIKTLVVQFAAYEGYVLTGSDNSYRTEAYPAALPPIGRII